MSVDGVHSALDDGTLVAEALKFLSQYEVPVPVVREVRVADEAEVVTVRGLLSDV